jgi:hypothetical protein
MGTLAQGGSGREAGTLHKEEKRETWEEERGVSHAPLLFFLALFF